MTDIGFYHLQRSSLEQALPRLLEKALQGGYRVLLRTPAAADTERLNVALWTYGEASFLPHGSAQDGWETEQPIFLTELDENPNRADLVCQVGGAETQSLASFRRGLDLFDGHDEAAVAAARDRWKRYRSAGHGVSYWQEKPGGGWELKS